MSQTIFLILFRNESSKLSEEDLIRLENNASVKNDGKKVTFNSLDNVEEIKLDDKPTLTRKRNEKKIKKASCKTPRRIFSKNECNGSI